MSSPLTRRGSLDGRLCLTLVVARSVASEMTDVPQESTVIDAIAALRAAGYIADFGVTADGRLRCGVCGATHAPSEAVVESVTRIEGISDPDDEAMVFGLACHHCGTRGVLVTAFGPSASSEEAAVVTALVDGRQR